MLGSFKTLSTCIEGDSYVCARMSQWELFSIANCQGCTHTHGHSMDIRGMERGIVKKLKKLFWKCGSVKINNDFMEMEEEDLHLKAIV